MGYVAVNPHAHRCMDKSTDVGKRGNVPPVKTPEERGPLGAWAYETRDQLGLSVEQVVYALPKRPNPATLRKAESNSSDMSRPLWRALVAYYQRMARERGVPIDPPPLFGDERAPTGDLAAALARQTAAIEALVAELREARLDRARLEGVERAVATLVEASLPTGGASPERPAPHATTG